MTGTEPNNVAEAERSLDQRFSDAMGDLLGPAFPGEIGLAVSGGGDSMAMLTLAHNWTRAWGVKLWVVTVDHGLRPESASEAAMVARECATLGWPHATLRWHWDGTGNLQDAGRRARLDLIGRWRGGLRHVLMAHTRDDVAETFLMRLKRGSGVEGLSAMRARRNIPDPHIGAKEALPKADISGEMPPPLPLSLPADHSGGFEIIRPCLTMRRSELRHYLTVLKTPWAEDPSNEDQKYDRVRMRRLLEDLQEVGLGVDRLSQTADRLRRAQDALRQRAAQVWRDVGREGRTGFAPTGDILFARDGFAQIERDTQLRLLAGALQFVATAPYRPREEPLEAVLDRVLAGGAATLHGCEIRAERDDLRVYREEKPLTSLKTTVGDARLWDQRWAIALSDAPGVQIGCLGDEGWRQLEKSTDKLAPYHAARSLPALWDGAHLYACPALGIGPRCPIALRPFGQELLSFTGFLLSH